MIDHHTRFRENDDLPLLRGPAEKKKPPRVKLCAVGMRNEILGNNLKKLLTAARISPASYANAYYTV